jgi:hypothetical protein
MQKRAAWVGMLTGAMAGAGSRVLGFAFGKAIAFTYAVIVSVVANVVFDFVRHPPPGDMTEPIAADAVMSADRAAARAALPAPVMAAVGTAPLAPPAAASPAAAAPVDNPRPGPGSGGLY